MTRQTGWITAAMLAIAAVFGISILPSRNVAGTASTEAGQPKREVVQQKPSGHDSLQSPCSAIENRIREFLPHGNEVAPAYCYTPAEAHVLQAGPSNPTLHLLIATLPNPVHTHFSLTFDRLAEALQQAAQDQGYIYDSSWLPWSDKSREHEDLEDQQSADAAQGLNEASPGVLVFRKALPDCMSPGATPDCVSSPYKEGMIIFVVSENPTGGVNAAQFNNAVAWISSLSGGDLSQLRILGPAFSGSFPSLAGLLTDADKDNRTGSGHTEVNSSSSDKAAARSPIKVRVYSGGASSRTGITWFRNYLHQHFDESTFLTFQESDDLLINRYCWLLRQQGYDTGRLAIISEDETAFGAIAQGAMPEQSLHECEQPGSDVGDPDPANSPHGPLYLYYPRDIASLRAAYEKQSVFGSNQPQSSGRTGLSDTLAESGGSDRDTIRTYGGEQSPVSRESTMLAIVNLLRSHGIEFIVLRSSNPLDQIFLVRFFDRTYPDARIVLTNSDLMFRRSYQNAGFRGTMTLSTYPLLTWQQDWTFWQKPESRHSHRAFPDSGSQGLYLAARFLMGDSNNIDDRDPSNVLSLSSSTPSKSSAGVIIQDYASPSWLLPRDPAATQPPTWVAVIGNNEIWPVAVISHVPKPAEQDKPTPSSTLAKANTDAPYAPARLAWPLSLRVAFICLFIWFGWHLYCCVRGSHTSFPTCLAYFAPVPGARHKVLVFLGCGVLALLVVLLASFTGYVSEHPPILQLPFSAFLPHATVANNFNVVYAVYAGLWLSAVIALLANLTLPHRRTAALTADEQKTEEAYWHATGNELGSPKVCSVEVKECQGSSSGLWIVTVAFLVLTALFFLIFRGWLFKNIGEHNVVFTYWRSVNLLSGVSPLVPYLLLAAGLYAWFWHTLRGLALFNCDRPRLPQGADLDKRFAMFSDEHAARPVEDVAMPLGASYWIFLGLLLLAVALVFWVLTTAHQFYIRSLGSRTYGRIYFGWLCLSIALISADAWQLLRTWTRLRRLLVHLDRLPLRRTLEALKGFSWGTVWRMSGSVLPLRYHLISREMEAFRHLKNQVYAWQATQFKKLPPAYAKRITTWEASRDAFAVWYNSHHLKPGLIDLSLLARHQAETAKTAGSVMNDVIIPEWQKEKQSWLLDWSPAGAEAGTQNKELAKTLPPHLLAAEEFFVLPYLGFVQNVTGRMRTLAMGMLWLFIAATLSVASYPFDPRPLLSGIFLVVFLIVAAIFIFVYAQMHRDTTLSHITNTKPGELGLDFWTKLIGLGAGPLLALLTALFPEFTSFISSWLQPGMQAMK